MKPLSLAVLIISFLFLFSCKKRIDFEAPCKILTLVQNYRYSPAHPLEIKTLTFNYNSNGDPSSLIFDQTGTGFPNYYFVYDKKGKLGRFYGTYGQDHYEFFTKYYYNNNNFITHDTTFSMFLFTGDTTDPYTSFRYYTVHQYEYDSKGRISRIDHKYGSNEWSITYNYNSQGNLITPGVEYDNKVNFLRTNLVLSFIERNYSMNNAGTPLSYNSKKLPLSFSNEWLTDPQVFFQNMRVHEINYACGHQHNKYD